MADLRAPGALDAPEALVPLARAGDRLALARIVRLYRAEMAGVAFVVTLDDLLAIEAVRRAWPVASRRLGSLREPARLGPWLCAIAAREARGLARSRRSRNGLTARRASSDPALEEALGALVADDRLLLALRLLAGASPAELAQAASRRDADPLARLAAAEVRLDVGPPTVLAARLRAFAAIPLPPVDIDAEARRAIMTRNDERIRIASLAVAILVTTIVVSFSYVVGPPPLPPGLTAPSPSPSIDASPPPDPDA